ncbi:urease accessory protein UreD [Sulfobacillus thermosulfidooxidans]|uniref:urease accessory protein UreD n=1 Tax=Sulfobacillus thermosulfidooxidans TaxID=28034 RepID=UPI0006B6819E|nr:urease accessory protein UreD [Sulfobacillus thermosulfidooxidans]
MTISRQRIHVYPQRIDTYFEPPLHLFVLNHSSPFHVVSAELGGILEDDFFETEIIVEPHARLWLSTQEATKLLAMPSGSAGHRWHIILKDHAQLVSIPHAIIPYAHSDFTQTVTCELGHHATLMWAEEIIAGRLAHGERFQFRHFHSRMTVMPSDSSDPLYHENLCFKPLERFFHHDGSWEQFTAWGSLLVMDSEPIADHVNPDYSHDVRCAPYQFGHESRDDQKSKRPRQYQGFSPIRGGYIWRVMSEDPQRVHDDLQAAVNPKRNSRTADVVLP